MRHEDKGSAYTQNPLRIELKYRVRPQPSTARRQERVVTMPLVSVAWGFHIDQEACKFQIEGHAKKKAKKARSW